MSRKISSRPVVIVPIRPEIPSILSDYLGFPFSLLLVLLDPLILINAVHKPTHTLDEFPGQRLSQVVLGGQTNVESPYSYVIKIPILLNISYYLSKYVFKVSPSRIAMDNKESRGRRTLLQVTK